MKVFARRISALLIAVVLVLMFPGCAVREQENESTTGEQLKFQHAAQDREVGVTQSLIKYETDYAYGVHYPSIGIEDIDKAIKNTAQGIIDEFTDSIKDAETSSDDRCVLSADYKSYLTDANGKKFVSVVFDIKTDIPVRSEYSERIKTCLYDLSSKKEIGFDEFFIKGSEAAISKKVTSYFKNNRLFAAMTDTELFKSGTAPEVKNFNSFAVVDGNVVFYFDKGSIFESGGCVEAVISAQELRAVISPAVLKAVFPEVSAESQSSSKPPADKPAVEVIEKPTEGTQASTPSGPKYIAFTFDDGPNPKTTNRILDVLEKTNSHATFFVLGTRVGSYADTVKRAVKLGCEIGNHSYSHANMQKIDKSQRMKEINKTNALLEEITGQKPCLMRVPFGAFKGVEKDFNMPLIQWSIDTEDWKYSDTSKKGRSEAQRNADKKKIVSSVLDHATGGEIVLMHDLYDMTAEAFEEMVPVLIKRGFVLVTVSELYEIYNIELEPGCVYRTPKNKEVVKNSDTVKS